MWSDKKWMGTKCTKNCGFWTKISAYWIYALKNTIVPKLINTYLHIHNQTQQSTKSKFKINVLKCLRSYPPKFNIHKYPSILDMCINSIDSLRLYFHGKSILFMEYLFNTVSSILTWSIWKNYRIIIVKKYSKINFHGFYFAFLS